MDVKERPPAPPSRQADVLRSQTGVRHGFFGRRGGVSSGLYASLNAGPGSQDDAQAVEHNRARLAQALGVADPEYLLTAYQIHSADAVVVGAPWTGERPRADGLVTRAPGLAIAVLTADCAPVLFIDPAARVIGVAHAGWRGALGGIIEATVSAMASLGAEPGRICAAIGPCIGWDAYEVGPEFVDRIANARPEDTRFFRPGEGDRSFFDLKAYVAERLARAGIASIESLSDCTFTDEVTYFSHRRALRRGESDYGRNLSGIVLDAED